MPMANGTSEISSAIGRILVRASIGIDAVYFAIGRQQGHASRRHQDFKRQTHFREYRGKGRGLALRPRYCEVMSIYLPHPLRGSIGLHEGQDLGLIWVPH